VSGVWSLFAKEMRQAVRDRRTVFITVFFPLVFYPLLFGFMGGLIRKEESRLAELVPRVLVVAEGEDALARALREARELEVWFVPDVAVGKEELTGGYADVVLEVRPVPERGELGYALTLYGVGTRPEAQAAVAKVKAFLQAYFQGVVLARLSDLGIDPKDLEPPFSIAVVDVEGETALGRMLLSRMLPYFLVLSIISGAMGFGAEITAGEKERGTLATLLVSRLTRTEVVAGKFLAILAVSLTTTFLSAVGLLLGIRSFGAGLGGLSLAAAGWILVLLLPLAMALAAVVLIVGSFARNQKEASAYLLPLVMLIVLVGVSTMVGTAEPQGARLAIPIAGPLAAIQRALAGTLAPAEVGWAFLSSLALALGLLAIAVRVFRSEQVLFRV
jgi:sodium transport system permease protein